MNACPKCGKDDMAMVVHGCDQQLETWPTVPQARTPDEMCRDLDIKVADLTRALAGLATEFVVIHRRVVIVEQALDRAVRNNPEKFR